jgi:hypothetical protein
LFFCSLAPSNKVVAVNDSNPDYAAEIPSTPYAKEIATHLNQDHINRITRVIEEIGMSDWLEAHPLSRLELTHQVFSDRGTEINGMYSFNLKIMQIATTRRKSEFGQPFEWQRVFSVSSTGDTPLEATRRTLVHELGHHVHNILKEVNRQKYNQSHQINWLAGGTQYAMYSTTEYFAESFALYVYQNTVLRDKNPETYDMMEQALKEVGLEVKHL